MTFIDLERALREARDELEAEKRKTLFILEKEQKQIKTLQQEKKLLTDEVQKLQQIIVEKERQFEQHSVSTLKSVFLLLR